MNNIYAKEVINKPFLPPDNFNKPKIKYYKSYYNSSHIRYYFKDIFLKRQKYEINYSYIPYQRINKLISYEENANYIYHSTGMLNITKLDYYYYYKNIQIETSKFNHIHLAMGFDINYTYLSTISIASILNI